MRVGYWQDVVDNGMSVPYDRALPDLTAELVETLGSPDPHQRDELAFPVLATWIGEGVYDDVLATLGDAVADGLTSGIDRPGTDEVFRRSFSALVLGCCLQRDTATRVLTPDTVLRWADHAIGWYVREHDCRGWVDGHGWAHAVAHGADLLGELASSRHVNAEHARVLLGVVIERLRLDVPDVWIDGEDDRLAYATMRLLQRNLVDDAAVDAWVDDLGGLIGETATGGPTAGTPTVEARNASAYARALHLQLAAGISPAGSGTSPAPGVRADLLLGLLRVMPRLNPWLHAGGPGAAT